MTATLHRLSGVPFALAAGGLMGLGVRLHFTERHEHP